MCALTCGVGRYPVNSDRRHNQLEQPECSDKGSSNALAEARKLFAQFERGHIEHYQVGIQFMGCFLHRLCESQRISSHTRIDNHGGLVNLVQRQIDEWHWLFIQAIYFAVPRHTDHPEPFVCVVRIELLAEWFLIRPVAPHKCFADDYHALRTLRVLQREG